MSGQALLPFALETPIDARARRFHEQNPEVFQLFARFALEAARAGRRRIGAKAVWERIRWENPVATNGKPYRLNNSFTAWYARRFVVEYPQHRRLFEMRGPTG